MGLNIEVENYIKGISENLDMYFVGGTLKNPLEYIVGEEIIFKIRVKSDEKYIDVPYILYELSSDDGNNQNAFCEKSEDGWFYIKTDIKRDGFVRLVARACDENKNEIEKISQFEGGAGANIAEISCETDVPNDYFEHWDWIKKQIKYQEPEVIYKKEFEVSKYPEHYFCEMHIKVSDDMYSSFVYSYPKNAKNNSLKLKILYKGYGTSNSRPMCIQALQDTLCVFQETHSMFMFKDEEYYENLRRTTLRDYGFSIEENNDPKTSYWAQVFMRDFQTLRYFKYHPLLNKKDYIFAGGSQGAFQACNMAAHSGVATGCELILPWMCDLAANEKIGRLKGWRPKYTKGLAYYDTAVAAKFLKCDVKITAGLGDYICPPSGQMALYNNICAPKSITFIQNKTHSNNPKKANTYSL